MAQKNLFIGRKQELHRLTELTKKPAAAFVVIKGRRRIGKSRLIDEFAQQFTHYYHFAGIAPEQAVTSQIQLKEFCHQIARQFHTAPALYPDWSDAFWAIGERVQSGKILLFFDELSWLAWKDPTFLGKIKNFWDMQLSKNNQLVFVVCSSASSWLEKNLLSSMGFVGRISFTLTLRELPLADCNQFWPQHISAYEKLKTLAVTGGIPKYLEEINPKLPAEENIKQLCFSSGGFLVEEFKHIFSDLFLRKSAFYKKITQALATGPKEQNEIQKLLCKNSEDQHYGRIAEYLWELEEAGFISRDYTWNPATGHDAKLSQYRLKDNYLRFYLKYIEKNLNKIKRDSFALKSLAALPEWHTLLGYQFENLVLNNRKAIQKILGIKPEEIICDNPFFQRKTTNPHSAAKKLKLIFSSGLAGQAV